jgi:SRSO17 transposase
MVGQFSALERKSMTPLPWVKNGNIRAMQHFISKVTWDDKKKSNKYRNMIDEDLSDPNGVLIFGRKRNGRKKLNKSFMFSFLKWGSYLFTAAPLTLKPI